MSEKLTIFISYRRGDEQDFVERIRDWFVQRYGADNVFMDFAHIPPYVKFKDFIRQRLDKSDVFIPIIGPRWLELLRAKADDDEEDFVLFEIETALQLGIMIAPIRIKGGVMPKKKDLPESIRELVDYNAPELVGGAAFLKDIQGLVEAVEIGWKQRKGGAGGSNNTINVQHYMDEATAKWKSGDLNSSIELATKAIQLDPTFAPAYSRRGNSFRELGELDRALADLHEAIRLDPKFAVAYNNRGLARKAKGDLDGALADYNEAIRLDPKYASAYFNRGLARQTKGDLDETLADYNEAIRLDLKFAIAYNNRGLARQTKGDLDGAMSDYNEAIRLDPKDANAYINRGNARQTKGDLDGALADYDEAIRLDPKFAIAYINRGILYHFNLSKYPAALRDYEQYLALGGTDTRVEGWIRELKKKLGK